MNYKEAEKYEIAFLKWMTFKKSIDATWNLNRSCEEYNEIVYESEEFKEYMKYNDCESTKQEI